jgi:hypothetical protein
MLAIARKLDAIHSLLSEREEFADWSSTTWSGAPKGTQWAPVRIHAQDTPLPPERSPEWLDVAQQVVADSPRAAEIVEIGDGTTDIVIKGPSPEKMQARRAFATHVLKLNEYLGDEQNWADVYAKGGPLWLYLGNRELVMSYPQEIKKALIEDVEEDSPQDAHEMGRDLLKFPCETGPGSVGMRMAE